MFLSSLFIDGKEFIHLSDDPNSSLISGIEFDRFEELAPSEMAECTSGMSIPTVSLLCRKRLTNYTADDAGGVVKTLTFEAPVSLRVRSPGILGQHRAKVVPLFRPRKERQSLCSAVAHFLVRSEVERRPCVAYIGR